MVSNQTVAILVAHIGPYHRVLQHASAADGARTRSSVARRSVPSAPGAKSAGRRKQLGPVVLEREYDHAVEIDMSKAHRGDEPQNRGIDFTTRGLAPGI
jgi:hypothetical protein